jgi:hypothetical protein
LNLDWRSGFADSNPSGLGGSMPIDFQIDRFLLPTARLGKRLRETT